VNDATGGLLKQPPLVIGIYGRGCSGKDSVAQRIASVNKHVLHINMDIFFKNKTNCPYGKNKHECWEHTDVIWFDRLCRVISALKNGKGVTIKDRSAWYGSYDCKIFSRDLHKPRIIIVQGFLLFTDSQLINLFDGKLFLNVSDKNIIERSRDRRENYNSESYIREVVIPVSKEYAHQSKVADKSFDTNKDTIENITDKLVGCINTKFGKCLISPMQGRTWEVKEGDLLSDHEWHPIDFSEKSKMIQEGIFEYRRNPNTDRYEVRLSHDNYRHIFRYV
jgi:uridine kinase